MGPGKSSVCVGGQKPFYISQVRKQISGQPGYFAQIYVEVLGVSLSCQIHGAASVILLRKSDLTAQSIHAHHQYCIFDNVIGGGAP